MAQRSPFYIDSDFLKLWDGESISVFGNQFSPIPIQYAAKTKLNAEPIQFGILAALAFLLVVFSPGREMRHADAA